ncbi:MAG: lipopolysaccharide biosynthesis protein [Bacteroidales bacterium]|nr:lipopolysaccharide biosynthesis protein [Bacteroidales bacterium]
MNLKSLARDTAIYGLSSIVGRFLNYLLVPVHTNRIAVESGGYGIVTNLYAYTALFFALLTFGMETTLFRFSNRSGEDPEKVYGTSLKLVGGVGLAFVALVLVFLGPIASSMGYAAHPEYVGAMALIVAMDAFQAIMFSHLRLEGKAVKFMLLKFAFIVPNVLLNLFIFLVMPFVPMLQGVYARFNDGVGLIFFANLICTAGVFGFFGSELKGLRGGFDRALAGRMLGYSWPLLLLSLVGILNQVADKILFPFLYGGGADVQLGIYGACVKIAMIMALLTQAFRYAYEPIVFGSSRDRNDPQTLADGMKYFIVFTTFAFLAVMFYMPLLKYFIGKGFWAGLGVVPIVMAAEVFMGVYFNLSFWYKLTDRTWWGAVLSAAGAIVMIAVNVVGVPRMGYVACAWGGFAGYGTSMVLSYALGRRYYPVSYDRRGIGFFLVLGVLLYFVSLLPGRICADWPEWAGLVFNTALLAVYGVMVYKKLIK